MSATPIDRLDPARLALRHREADPTPWKSYRDAAEYARQRQSELPVLCFSPDRLQRQTETFIAGFPGHVSYAVKCNNAFETLVTLAEAGIACFDVASTIEMQQVRAACPAARFHYHNPVKSRAEITRAYTEFGCSRFAADHADEIAKIAELVGEPRDIEIAIRFRLPASGHSVHDFSTKFGATPETAAALMRTAAAAGFGVVLTFHPGSQCTDPEAWRRHIETAAEIARSAEVDLAALNVGGGFPARYLKPGVPELADIFRRIETAADMAFQADRRPLLECEPGRAMVATSRALLTRVKAVRMDSREAFINDGIYGALMEMSQAPDLAPPYRAIRTEGKTSVETALWTVYGPTCDPLDVLPLPLELPQDLIEGDYIEFGTLGAYGTATATRFNGYGLFETAFVDRVLAAT